MVAAITAGVVLGLSAGLTPGPLFALVMAQALKHNTKEGVKVAFAPLITDFPIVLISLLILDRFSEAGPVLGSLSIIGGAYVVYLAWESFHSEAPVPDADTPAPRSLLKGTLVNALSPHPYLFWITVGAPLMIQWRNESGLIAAGLFLFCFFFFFIGAKIVLACIVGRSRQFLSGKSYHFILRSLGVLLAIFGLLLLRHGVLFFLE